MTKLISALHGRRRRIIFAACALCAAALLAGALFPGGASADDIPMSALIEGVEELTEAAEAYIETALVAHQIRPDANKLVLTYIRQKVYNSDAWNLLCGTNVGNTYTGFAAYVSDTYKTNIFNTAASADLQRVAIDETGEITDALHMFAVLDVMNSGYENAGGWAGDVVQLVAAIKTQRGGVEELTAAARALLGAESGSPFGAADLIADLDACNIFSNLSSSTDFNDGTVGLAEGISGYFAGLTPARRVYDFASERLGGVAHTRDDYREEIYTRYYADEYMSITNVIKVVEVSEGLRDSYAGYGIPMPAETLIVPCTETHIRAANYAFADYLYDSLTAPAPVETDIAISYSAETAAFDETRFEVRAVAAGEDADVSDDDFAFDRMTPIESGGAIGDYAGGALYARGKTGVEGGYYMSPSEVLEIPLPPRPSAPGEEALIEPEELTLTHSGVSFTPAEGLEYSLDGSLWDNSGSFNALSPATDYTLRARVAATESDFRSEDVEVCAFTTPRAPYYPIDLPPAETSPPEKSSSAADDATRVGYRVTGSSAALSLDADKTAAVIEGSSGSAVFDISSAKGVTSAALPASAARAIADAGLGITLKTEGGEVALDSAAARAVAERGGDGSVSISIKVTEDGDSSVKLSLEARAANIPVADFAGGSARVSVPFSLPDGVAPTRVVPYRDGGGGSLSLARGGYNAGTGCAELRLGHFSDYVIRLNDERYEVSGGWYDESLDFAAQRGLLDRFTVSGVVNADSLVTREDFIAVYMKAAAIEPPEVFTAEQFEDVDPFSPNAAYIRAARELGIVNGVGDDKFAPALPAARAHFFQVMYNALQVGLTDAPDTDTGRDAMSFEDAYALPGWVLDAVNELVRRGMISGDGGSLDAGEAFTVGTMCKAVKALVG